MAYWVGLGVGYQCFNGGIAEVMIRDRVLRASERIVSDYLFAKYQQASLATTTVRETVGTQLGTNAAVGALPDGSNLSQQKIHLPLN